MPDDPIVLLKRTNVPYVGGGKIVVWAKPDGSLWWRERDGAETPVLSEGGSGIPQGGPATEPLDMDGNAITGLTNPTDPQDAATKAYVDENAGALMPPVTINLSAGQIATLSSVPVEVVAAPGANKAIVPVAATFQFVTGVTAFDFDADCSVLVGGLAVDFAAMGFSVTSSFIQSALASPGQPAENTALMFAADGVDPDGAGDGTARLTVLYYVFDLAV